MTGTWGVLAGAGAGANGNIKRRVWHRGHGDSWCRVVSRRPGIELLESKTLLAAVLARDANVTPLGSSPHDVVEFAGAAYFAAQDDEHGTELWTSDGTVAGTRMIKDINPGIAGSAPQALSVIGGKLFFVAQDGLDGFELWMSDGTDPGTSLVQDIRPGPDSGANPESFGPCDVPVTIADLNGLAFFPADDGEHGFELWASDGTAQGTHLVADLNPGPATSCPSELKPLADQIVFSATGVQGRELYRASESAATMIADIWSGSPGANPSNLTAYNGAIFFSAEDGQQGRELWKTDGLSASLVKDIYPGPIGSWPAELVASGGDLLFTADDGSRGTELWQSDGTRDTTSIVADIYPGPASSVPLALTDVNGRLFFNAFRPDVGTELWNSYVATDDQGVTRRFATLAADINPTRVQQVPNSSVPANLTSVGDRVFFSADDGQTGRELWTSSISSCQSPNPQLRTQRVADIATGPASSDPEFLTSVDGRLFYAANNPTTELWTTIYPDPPPNCPAPITKQVADLNDTRTADSLPVGLPTLDFVGRRLADGNVEFYFAADDGTRGNELWKGLTSRVGTTSINRVADLNPGPSGSNPSEMVFAKDTTRGNTTLYFSAFAPATGVELWKIGPAGQPLLVADLDGAVTSSNPRLLTTLNDDLYFVADSGLWRSDGTSQGTESIASFRSPPSEIVAVGNRLYFNAADAEHGWEIWQSDGTGAGTQIIADIHAGQPGSFPHDLTSTGGALFFGADDGNQGDELYAYTPTAGLSQIEINVGPAGSFPQDLTHVSLGNPSGILYLTADDGVHGREIHAIDLSGGGNPDGLVMDIAPGAASSFPNNLTRAGEQLFYAADDGRHGSELWRTVPTIDPDTNTLTLSTALVRDIHVGSRSSLPLEISAVGDTVYFAATDGNYGEELWRSDGTAEGTVLATDIHPGGLGSRPSGLTAIADFLVLAADDGTTGFEVWVAGANARLVGDANGDGRFDSSDLILVFQAGEYEDGVADNSAFEEGDWNGDRDFDASDLLLAFQSGVYADRRLPAVAAPAPPTPVSLNAVSAALLADAAEGQWTRRQSLRTDDAGRVRRLWPASVDRVFQRPGLFL